MAITNFSGLAFNESLYLESPPGSGLSTQIINSLGVFVGTITPSVASVTGSLTVGTTLLVSSQTHLVGKTIVGVASSYPTVGGIRASLLNVWANSNDRFMGVINEGLRSGGRMYVAVSSAASGVFAFPTAGTTLGGYDCMGAEASSSSFVQGGGLEFRSTTDWSGTNRESNARLQLAGNSATTLSDVLVIDSDGRHVIGKTSGTARHRFNMASASAGANALTTLNGPTGTSGNPTWFQFDFNGTNYVVPAWSGA